MFTTLFGMLIASDSSDKAIATVIGLTGLVIIVSIRSANRKKAIDRAATPGKRTALGRPVVELRPRSGGGISCPNCGGTSFKTRRATGTKVAIGLFSLMTKPTQVECVTCGWRYSRSNGRMIPR